MRVVMRVSVLECGSPLSLWAIRWQGYVFFWNAPAGFLSEGALNFVDFNAIPFRG